MQQLGSVFGVVLVIVIQTEHERLNHQVSKSVGSCGKHIGDAGIDVLIITRVGGELPGNNFWAHNMEEVVPVGDDLKHQRETDLTSSCEDIQLQISIQV